VFHFETTPAATDLRQNGSCRAISVETRMNADKRESFQRIYDENARDLLAYLMRSLRQESVARDLLQDAFLNFIRIFREKELPETTACRMYLFRTARNLLINYTRSSRVRLEVSSPDAGEFVPSSPLSTEESVLHQLDAELREEVLQEVLAELDEQDRSILQMRHAHGMKLEEIAGAMDMSISTVSRRLDRSASKLMSLLKKREGR
jgi:RNA polymerase sigma-70 factor (ECF subfamily)